MNAQPPILPYRMKHAAGRARACRTLSDRNPLIPDRCHGSLSDVGSRTNHSIVRRGERNGDREMIFNTVLILATLLCSLVAGFLFAFAVVAMPGIARLDDSSFIRAFQVMDGVIQDNHPMFMFVWVGSALALIASAAIGFSQLEGLNRVILVIATVAYLLGVQFPTVRVNIPLNNEIQTVRVDQINGQEAAKARSEFESQWNRWNLIRSIVATLVALALIVLLLRM
jgi:uncharacterized membrane protein